MSKLIESLAGLQVSEDVSELLQASEPTSEVSKFDNAPVVLNFDVPSEAHPDDECSLAVREKLREKLIQYKRNNV